MKEVTVKRIIIPAVLAFQLSCLNYANSQSLPAFPGAEGFGANSIGGRGGTVIKVTNLNDYGPGSLREAVEAPPRGYANNTPQWETLAEYEARVAAGNTRPRHYPHGVWKNELEADYIKRLEDTGHRIVVFEVSGIINLQADLNITYAYMTIAGQTSPGGILVTGHQTTIKSHDIIMRYMRFRVGTQKVKYDRDSNGDIIYYDQAQYDFPPTGTTGNGCKGNITTKELGFPCAIAGGANTEEMDSLDIWGKRWSGFDGAYNIILDHISASWGVDETLTISGGVRNTTLQWSIISEGLRNAGHPEPDHSKGLLVSGKYTYDTSISVHHNYIAHNHDRSPLIYKPEDANQEMIVDVVNNVSYNWYAGLSPMVEGTPKVNWVQNYAKRGPDSGNSGDWSYELAHYNSGQTPAALLYVTGNIGASRQTQDAQQWTVGHYYWPELEDTVWRTDTPWPVPPVTTTEMSYDYALEILKDVGATKPFRDDVDARVVADFAAGTGRIIDNIKYPDDFPTYPNLPPPKDSDNDGMADSWEVANGMNPQVNDSALDKDHNGYTNIEEYLHYLAGDKNVLSVPSHSDPPKTFQLFQNYPNPFNPTTTIKYSLGNAANVQLTIYNLRGQKVETLVNKTQAPGIYTVEFNAKLLSSGIYWYSLKAGDVTITKKLLLLK